MKPQTALALLILAATCCLFILAAGIVGSIPAYPHSWYEPACCSGRDCEPISFDAVTESADGWTVDYYSKQGFPVHAFVPRGKERHSHDGRFHGCATSTRFLCLYTPVNS